MKRRICWPYPDAVCLQGGCGYCNLSPFRSVGTLYAYARERNLLDALDYGISNNFFNIDVRD